MRRAPVPGRRPGQPRRPAPPARGPGWRAPAAPRTALPARTANDRVGAGRPDSAGGVDAVLDRVADVLDRGGPHVVVLQARSSSTSPSSTPASASVCDSASEVAAESGQRPARRVTVGAVGGSVAHHLRQHVGQREGARQGQVDRAVGGHDRDPAVCRQHAAPLATWRPPCGSPRGSTVRLAQMSILRPRHLTETRRGLMTTTLVKRPARIEPPHAETTPAVDRRAAGRGQAAPAMAGASMMMMPIMSGTGSLTVAITQRDRPIVAVAAFLALIGSIAIGVMMMISQRSGAQASGARGPRALPRLHRGAAPHGARPDRRPARRADLAAPTHRRAARPRAATPPAGGSDDRRTPTSSPSGSAPATVPARGRPDPRRRHRAAQRLRPRLPAGRAGAAASATPCSRDAAHHARPGAGRPGQRPRPAAAAPTRSPRPCRCSSSPCTAPTTCQLAVVRADATAAGLGLGEVAAARAETQAARRRPAGPPGRRRRSPAMAELLAPELESRLDRLQRTRGGAARPGAAPRA